jgi:hypothetical protein
MCHDHGMTKIMINEYCIYFIKSYITVIYLYPCYLVKWV